MNSISNPSTGNMQQDDIESEHLAVPIDEIHQEFFQALKQSPVVVEAPTGCGKSTRLPLWCKETGRVLVVEPRRLPCRSLASYVARLDGTQPGEGVGFSIRFEGRYSEHSKIVFVTPGIALRWYKSSGFREFDTVVLDEFHERRQDTDLLAAILRGCDKGLVLTSATVEGDRLAKYLSGTRLQAQSKLYTVEVQYTEKDSLPRVKDLEKRVFDAVKKLLPVEDNGDILVFLPGKGEIQDVKSFLEKKGVQPDIIPLHASVEQKIQDQALRSSNKSRIILATNVAETSLTLPGVSVVIDSGLERRTHYRNGRTVLALSVISQAAADQRKGRAGRLGPGKCVRLWGRTSRLESYTPPEIVREDPAETVLAAAACGQRIEELRFPDPPPGQALDKAKSRLQQMGALDEQGGITKHGSSLFLLPLDSQLAHLITAMQERDTKSAMVDLASALTVQGSIILPNQPEGAVQQLKDLSPEPCDACTLIRLMRYEPPDKLRINPKTLAEAKRISVQIKEALNLDDTGIGQDVPREKLLREIITAAPELVYVRRVKRRWSMGNGQDEVEIGSGTRFPEKREAAIVLDRHSVPGQKGTTKTLTLATCLAPVSFEEISTAGLGEVHWKSPVFDGSRIKVNFERTYAGRVIDSWEDEPEGEMLCRAVAELILSNELWPGLGTRIQEDVWAWNLYVKLGFSSRKEREDANSWLVNRLWEIGVENNDDIFLVEEPDLDFPGVPESERKEFDRRYPRSISLANLELDVEYEPIQKRITLVRRSGIRRSPPKRWELPSWGRNWTIFFKDGNRVVPVD